MYHIYKYDTMDLVKLWKNHSYEIIVFICLIILVLLLIFHKFINNKLKGKQDFELPDYAKNVKNKHNITSLKNNIITKKNETKCRQIFEKIFNKPFPNVRPEFMRRKNNGNKLELDGYNQDLKLAFEYNGIQHYKFSPRFHKSYSDFMKQLQRDIEKRELCREHGVYLIEIPYTIPYDQLDLYIADKIRQFINSK